MSQSDIQLGPKKIQVLFGGRRALEQSVPENSVLIVPADNNWNDFGHYTLVDYVVTLKGTRGFKTRGHIGFIGESPNGVSRLVQIVERLGELVVPVDMQHRFFTMLPKMQAYRDIVAAFGVDLANQCLLAVNDLVALGEFKPALNWLRAAYRTEVFSYSFVRESESFFASKNAGSILRGLTLEELGRLSQTIRVRFKLASFSNEHDLAFGFDHQAALPKRMAVIIGKNGVGKSQSLARIVSGALKGGRALTDGTERGRPEFSRLLAFAPTNETESVFPSDRTKWPRVLYRRFSLNRSKRRGRSENISSVIVELARSRESIRGKSRWKLFLDALKTISAAHQLVVPTHSKSVIPISRLSDGGEQATLERFAMIDVTKEPLRRVDDKTFPLSSGEISFLKFAAYASLYIENGSLVLLDEPETHLHPNFISKFVSLLDGLLRETGSAAIIATHSVYFVREVFQDQVLVLRVGDEREVLTEHPRLRTFGADVGAISFFVFGEEHPSDLANEVKERILGETAGWESTHERYKAELAPEFLGELREALERAQSLGDRGDK